MKTNLFFLLLFLSTLSCTQKTGLLMKTNSTIKVDETDTQESIITKAAHVVPTVNQYEALQNEFIAFIHFGPNTFTRMEWGNGKEDPKIFDLKNLDTDQWCEAMTAAGMKMVIITAKHHDGFVLWQSRYTKHGIMSTGYKNGKGDILKELATSCKKYGLKLGVYLSPADLYQIENKEGLYGNLSKYTERTIPRPVEGRPFANPTTFTFKVDDYNEYFLNQLFELLTEYGPIDEVWFDGAHPKRKGGQVYNYLAWKELIQELAPKAVVFGKQDIRWCGNEAGKTRDTEWNIIPYLEDPANMNRFGDLTAASLGQREDLYNGKYLHYQQAETNTSIREGWFYRDDAKQKVRSADDVFDMYERSVGGNSTFLLNIPPNREGTFSAEDVGVLTEVGNRIKGTYAIDLLTGATGPDEILDNDATSFLLLSDNSFEITTPSPITCNRFIIQEAIATHSERIEEFKLEAWINNEWKSIATATNVGYKRILRFPEITSTKFKITVLESRLTPTISKVSAHYYKTRPPQLSLTRNVEGILKIQPKEHEFGWKPHGEDFHQNINTGLEIRYTTDGSIPNKASKLYKKPFFFASGAVKASVFTKEEVGSVASGVFGIVKKDWKLMKADSQNGENKAGYAFDGDANTYWSSRKGNSHSLSIDLGKVYSLKGFAYSPQSQDETGMIESGNIQISKDGKFWEILETFQFGNLINDPTKRFHYFKEPINSQYVKISSTTIAGGHKNASVAEIDFMED